MHVLVVLACVCALASAAKPPVQFARQNMSELVEAYESVRGLPQRTAIDVARRTRLEGKVTTHEPLVGVSGIPYTPQLHGPFIRFLAKGGMVVGPLAYPGDLAGVVRAMYQERLGDDPYFELLHALSKLLVVTDDAFAYHKTKFAAFPEEAPLDVYHHKSAEMFMSRMVGELIAISRKIDAAAAKSEL